MASKIQIQKAQQGYTSKLLMCGNCNHYTSEGVSRETRWYGRVVEEKNKRCGLGGFAVKKTATCKLHAPKGGQ